MFTDKDKRLSSVTLKNTLLIITYTVFLIWIVLHISDVLGVVGTILNLLKPFIYGFMMAFLFNLPLKFFLRKLPSSLGKAKKSIAVLLSILIITLVLTFMFIIVVPQVIESITSLANSLPEYFASAEKLITKMIENKQIPEEFIKQINSYSAQIQDTILGLVKNVLPYIFNFAGGFASSVANVLMAFVIAVYLTISKEKLLRQTRRFLYAFLPRRGNRFCLKLGSLTNKTFSAFIAGQLVEAIIIGVLCYIGCLIFGFPYAPIMGVIIGVTNVIPIFGAIFGTGICALLVAFVSPIQGLLFVIFGICLQQFESNLIYPRVVGSTVGLSGLWVLFAITIGGGLFSLPGMLFGLPAFSVIYSLMREEMNRRVEKKSKPNTLIEVNDEA